MQVQKVSTIVSLLGQAKIKAFGKIRSIFYVSIDIYLQIQVLSLYDALFKCINSLPNDKFLDRSKLKAFADDKSKLTEKN